eukprot:TRINITY_DN2203_c0_g1_i1.p1 TRINITY_DN2203_c0_g1~~TRINITY_DN2203_c0_g1_i1.p1  ORF type:complete len:294 (+),score=76.50 TRINITY_DN2203_c0_g1_i1:62-883(+)
MTALVCLLALYLVVVRPYIAPYENVLEGLICVLETGILGMTLLAMGSANPTKHWGAELAGTLGFATVYVILLKFVLDLGVFLMDEYGEWAETQKGKAAPTVWGFAAALLGCKGSSRDYYQLMQAKEGAMAEEFGECRPVDEYSEGEEGVLMQDVVSVFSTAHRSADCGTHTHRELPTEQTHSHLSAELLQHSSRSPSSFQRSTLDTHTHREFPTEQTQHSYLSPSSFQRSTPRLTASVSRSALALDVPPVMTPPVRRASQHSKSGPVYRTYTF